MQRWTIAALTLASTQALAGGYYMPDSGIVAMGRGGAFIAGADNQFAQYYNPAGLIRIEGPQLNLGASMVDQNVTFSRACCDYEDQPFADAENQAKPFAIPQLGFATPLGDSFAFAFGFTSPAAPTYDYDPAGAQRYSITDTLIWNFQIGPSLAWAATPWLSIGAGLQWQALRVEESLKVTTSGLDNPTGDVAVAVSVWDTFSPSANLGVLAQPLDWLSLGLSVQLPTSFQASGQGVLDFDGNGLGDVLDRSQWTDEDISVNLTLPWVIRFGAQFEPTDSLQIETAFIYERWSALTEILVEDIDVTLTGMDGLFEQEVVSSIALPAGLQDTFSLRLGAEFGITSALQWRAGMLYEPAAIPLSEVSVAMPDADKFQFSTGFSIQAADRLLIDGAAAVVAYQTLNIEDSNVSQINVYEDGSGLAQTVGNGDLSALGMMAGLQATVLFGPTATERALPLHKD